VRALGTAVALSPPLTVTHEHFALITDRPAGALAAVAAAPVATN
jgi:hypothetical protein